jgi:hypothetical protein
MTGSLSVFIATTKVHIAYGQSTNPHARQGKTTQSSGGIQYQTFRHQHLLDENISHHPNDKELRIMAVLRAFLFEGPT